MCRIDGRTLTIAALAALLSTAPAAAEEWISVSEGSPKLGTVFHPDDFNFGSIYLACDYPGEGMAVTVSLLDEALVGERVVLTVEAGGDQVMLAGTVDLDEMDGFPFLSQPLEADSPLFAVLRSGRPVTIGGAGEHIALPGVPSTDMVDGFVDGCAGR